MKLFFQISLILFLFTSCSTEECKNFPEPIFEEEWVGIEKYSFEKKERKSTERFYLPSIELQVEINQNVCPKMRQNFQFIIPEKFEDFPDANWVTLTSNILGKLSSINAKVGMFEDYGIALSKVFNEIKLGEDFQLDGNFYVNIDKLFGLNETTLLVSFFEN